MASLQDLPVELVEYIVQDLDLQDIGSLRTACRDMRSKASQGRFKTFFISKRVDLTPEFLERFTSITSPGCLGDLIEHLTLVAVVYNTLGVEATLRNGSKYVTEDHQRMKVDLNPEELAAATTELQQLRQQHVELTRLHNSGGDLKLLAEAFSNIRDHAKGRLLSMSFDTVVSRDRKTRQQPLIGGSWKQIWKASARAWRLGLDALGSTSLPVETLDIYSGVKRCSVTSNEIGVRRNRKGFDAAFKGLRKISLSVTNRIIDASGLDKRLTGDPDDNIDWEAEYEQLPKADLLSIASDEANYTGPAELLHLAPALEELHLHWYETRVGTLSHSELMYERIFARIVATAQLPSLRVCRLRGLYVTGSDLLKFLPNGPIKDLALENVYLVKGGYWRPIFDYCSSEEAAMEKLHLEDIWESSLLHFDEDAAPKFPVIDGTWGPNTITRIGDEVRKRIGYHMAGGRAVGSPEAYIWRHNRKLEYGPP